MKTSKSKLNNFGSRLSYFRINCLGLSLEELSENLKIKIIELEEIEENILEPGLFFLQDLHQQYQLDLNWLIRGERKVKKKLKIDKIKRTPKTDLQRQSPRVRNRKGLPLFGDRLGIARRKIGKRQPDLSKELQLSVNSISGMENNKRNLTTYYVYCLFKRYQVSPAFLFSGKGDILLSLSKPLKKIRKKWSKEQELPPMGEYLTVARRTLEISQSDISQEFGISVNNISRMENDHDHISLYYVYLLYQIYNVNPVYLLGGEGEILLDE